MERNTVERVTEWDSEPFSGGYAGLHDLADREFTGGVTDGTAWLFMLNGRVLGVFDGDVSQFEGADGTAYVAPDHSLPLLFAMQEIGGAVRGEYYTEETALAEVDRTLQSGNFTGYVELSENVLSGNYYLAYYGGRRMAVAFVGNQERRLTGDEAFERAADEVGIYRVKTVDIDIVDVPEPADNETVTAGAASTETEPASEPESESTSELDPESTSEPDPESTSEPESTSGEPTSEESTPAGAAETPAPETDVGAADEPDEVTGAESTGADPESTTETTEGTTTPESPSRRDEATDEAASTAAEPSGSTGEGESESVAAADESADQFAAESAWQGTTTIPALDPAESVSMQTGGAQSGGDGSAAATTTGTEHSGVPSEEVEALREERDQLRERVEELEDETEQLERERDEAATTADELEAEIDELRATVEELEDELADARSELERAQEYIPEGDHELTPEEALAGTSLFVRYEREGGPTLEDAHDGDAEREAVNENIRLEQHTEFEDEGAVVDGEPFEVWLPGTIEYGFVQWLTHTFVHDVGETRNQTALGKLFDAIPDMDRIEFRGSVDIDGEDEEAQESAAFDVVLRDRMGQPLLVTDLNDSREPATEPMLESLIRNATPVAETNDRLAAAFFVTTSYFEPGALETAEEATGGGFLSRDSQKSFVKLSRTDGYHLCLAETREGEFHVTLPEL